MRSNGYATRLRRMILTYLDQNRSRTVTVKDILQYITEHEASASPTTVYRYLDRLTDEHKLIKGVADDGKTACYLYENVQNTCGEHLHLKCVDCGKVIHLDCNNTETFIRHVLHEHNFDIQCDNIILYGKCRGCQTQRTETTKSQTATPDKRQPGHH